jgi:NADH-quinone oxidoreductase subunit J
MPQLLFFFYFAGMTIFSSILTVGLRNPIYCTIALLSTFLHVAGLFILLHAEFIAAIQIIIYAGAVLVLYLFVLMLLNLKSNETFVHKQFWIALFFGIVILGEILLTFFNSPMIGQIETATPSAPSIGNTQDIGLSLYNQYIFQFEVVGILLLGGIIGALVLTKQVQAGPAEKTNGSPPRTPSMEPIKTPAEPAEEIAPQKVGTSGGNH